MSKGLIAFRVFVFGAMLAVFVYGLVFYIDAPLRPCGHGFCGKTGHPHTAAEYHAFLTWQAIFIITWFFGLPIHFAFAAAKRAER